MHFQNITYKKLVKGGILVLLCFLFPSFTLASSLGTSVTILEETVVEPEEPENPENPPVPPNPSSSGGGSAYQGTNRSETTLSQRQVILNVDITPIDDSTVKITWNTNFITRSTFSYCFTDRYELGDIKSQSYLETHTLVMKNLTAGITYYFGLFAESLDGFSARSNHFFTLTKSENQENQAPLDIPPTTIFPPEDPVLPPAPSTTPPSELPPFSEEISSSTSSPLFVPNVNSSTSAGLGTSTSGTDPIETVIPDPSVLPDTLLPEVEFVENSDSQNNPQDPIEIVIPSQGEITMQNSASDEFLLEMPFSRVLLAYGSYFFLPLVNLFGSVSVVSAVILFVTSLFL